MFDSFIRLKIAQLHLKTCRDDISIYKSYIEMSYKDFMVALCLDIPLKNLDGIYLDMLLKNMYVKFKKTSKTNILLKQYNFR